MAKTIIASEDYYGQNRVCKMTSDEFELYCLEILKGFAEQEGLKDFSIKHNVKLESYDGTYQIDILASFTVFGTQMTLEDEAGNMSEEERAKLKEYFDAHYPTDEK